MSKDTPPNLQHASHKEFLAAVNAEEPLAMVMKSHLCIEALLSLAISEFLTAPHALELRRLSFGLKAELAVALGIVPSDCRALFLAANRVRNAFAHDRRAEFTPKQAAALFSALSPRQRAILNRPLVQYDDCTVVFSECVSLLYVELESAITRHRDHRVYENLIAEEVKACISQAPADVAARRRYGEARERRMASRVEEERRKRAERGEL